jgi:hypothetical protein
MGSSQLARMRTAFPPSFCLGDQPRRPLELPASTPAAQSCASTSRRIATSQPRHEGIPGNQNPTSHLDARDFATPQSRVPRRAGDNFVPTCHLMTLIRRQHGGYGSVRLVTFSLAILIGIRHNGLAHNNRTSRSCQWGPNRRKSLWRKIS